MIYYNNKERTVRDMTRAMTKNPAALTGASGIKKVQEIRNPYDGLRFWSAFTHGAGAVLSALGGGALLLQASLRGIDALTVTALAVFAASMVALYLASCLYHCVNTSVHGRLLLRKLDHSMIYVLIAGTYTPICLSVLGGPLGWSLFGVIWGLAAVGVVVTLCWLNAPRLVTTLFYVGMGWMAVLALRPLIAALTPLALGWMLLGGVMYTVGGVLYALKWPLKNRPQFGCHEIFHVFVLMGSACFFAMMWVEFAV